MKRLSIGLFAIAAPLAAQAQERAPTQGPLVVVVGDGLAAPPGEAALATAILDRERIAASASDRLEDALAGVAGIAQFRRSDSRSAHPTSQGITLRGLGGNAASRALLLLDGVPQADPFGGWVPFPAYQLDRIGTIRVTRGGGSGYAGPGALAGTIELRSATPGELGGLTAAAAYGSRDSLDLSAAAGAGLGDGFVTLAGQYARGDGFVPLVRESRGALDRAAPYEQASAALRAVAPLGADAELQASVSGFTDRRDRGVDFTRIASDGADASVRVVGRGRWGWSALAYVQARQFASGFASVNDARDSVVPALDQYNVPSTGIGARVEIAPPLGGGVTLRLGADTRQVSGRTQERYLFTAGVPARRRVAGGESVTAGAFADLSVARGGWTFDAGGRLDHWLIADGRLTERALSGGAPITDARFPDRSGWEATGRVGVARQLGDTLALRGAGYLGWRLPTLNELYRPFRVGADATAANPTLAPERLNGVEAGLDWTPARGTAVSLTGFWNRLDHAVANVTLGTGPGTYPGVGFVAPGGAFRQRRNLDSIESRGIELDARWRRGAWWLGASWAFTDARVAATGAAAPLDGLRPAQTAIRQGSATLGWARRGTSASATLRYVGPQYEDDLNRRRLAQAFTLDARVAVPVAAGFAVELRGENLSDARVEAGISGTDTVERAIPRTLWIGLRYRPR